MEKKSTRVIPITNYIWMIIIVVFTCALALAFRKFYINNYNEKTSLSKYAQHLKANDIYPYLSENSSSIIYFASRYDLANEEFEEKLKNKIISYNLYDNFVYIDRDDLSVHFFREFNKKYNTSLSFSNIPSLIIVSDGSVANIYYNVNDMVLNDIEFGDVK